MKFHTKFRPSDLVKDVKTDGEGVIIEAVAIWIDKHKDIVCRSGSERKRRGETYHEGQYGIYPKNRDSSLNGRWYKEDKLELVKKGHLH